MPNFSMNIDYGKPQNQMSLGDIVQLARGAQAYQQAEEINPLQQQKARMEIEQAQKINPLTQQKATSEAQSAQMKAQKEKSELAAYYRDKTRQAYGGLLADPDFDPKNPNVEGMKAKLDEAKDYLVNVVGVPEHESKAHEKLLKHMTDHGVQGAQRVIQTIYNGVQQGQQLATQGEQINKAPNFVNTGNATVPVYTSPMQGAGPGRTPSLNQYLSPTVVTSETGAPMVIGGGGGNAGNVVNNPNVGVQPRPNVSTQQVNPSGATSPAVQNLNTSFNEKGGLQRAPDETYDAYKARVADLAAKPKLANQSLSLANQDSIPNQEYNNNKVLKLLESKNVRVGKLADAIAKKTGGIGLSTEEQEIQKYLEQRIRQNSLRSNQDENSQKMASGSFGTDINALRDIIYNDKGLLASQRLLSQGILKHQGNPNKPNLAAINKFENDFNLLNQDRNVTHLLGIVGDKSIDELSASDVQQLKRTFGGMSKKQMDELFAKKQALEDLVHGAK